MVFGFFVLVVSFCLITLLRLEFIVLVPYFSVYYYLCSFNFSLFFVVYFLVFFLFVRVLCVCLF